MKNTLIILVALFGLGSCQLVSDGQCPEITSLQRDLNGPKFLGRWYQVGSFPSELSCTIFDLSVNDGKLKIDLSASAGGKPLTATGTGKNLGDATWEIKFSHLEESGKYQMLKTDYDTYAVGYGCQNLDGNKKIEDLRIVSRTKTLPANIVNEVIGLIKQNNISIERMTPTKQTGCSD